MVYDRRSRRNFRNMSDPRLSVEHARPIMKSDPIYQSDECPDYRRLLITYPRTQPLDIFSIERELIDFVPKPYVEFTIADLRVKVWNLTNESLSVDNAIDRLKKDARFAGYGVERDMRL